MQFRGSAVALCALAMLAACSGNTNGGAGNALPAAPVASPASQESTPPDASVVPQTATPTPMPTIYTAPGKIVGLDNQFTPNDGDTSIGGNGATIDGLLCSPTMYGSGSEYHVHVFLGLLVNGREIAIPDAIGMHNPGAESNGMTNSAQCYYPIHTHDAGGYIHLEANSTVAKTYSLYSLGQLLDIWGERLSATGFGPYGGTTTVFYATTPFGSTRSGTYVQYTGTAPRNIRLYSHETIWIEVGTVVPASRLPKVTFYSMY